MHILSMGLVLLEEMWIELVGGVEVTKTSLCHHDYDCDDAMEKTWDFVLWSQEKTWDFVLCSQPLTLMIEEMLAKSLPNHHDSVTNRSMEDICRYLPTFCTCFDTT